LSTQPRRTGGIDPLATTAIVGTLLCWSSTPIWIKHFTGYFDPFSQNVYRYAFALLFWLPFLIVRQATGRVPRSIWLLALAPAIPNTAMQTFWAWSLYHLDPGVMALLARMGVIWSTLLSMAVFADERLLARSKRFWCGLGCGLAGAVGVLAFKPGFVAGLSRLDVDIRATVIGAGMVTTATALWSVYAVMVRLRMRGVDSRTAFAVIALETTVGLSVIAIVFGDPARVVDVPLNVMVLVALSGWICIALAHVCYYTAIRRVGVAVPTAVLQLTPFAVLTLSYFIFDERFAPAQLASGAVLVIGSGLALWAQDKVRRGAAKPCDDGGPGDEQP